VALSRNVEVWDLLERLAAPLGIQEELEESLRPRLRRSAYAASRDGLREDPRTSSGVFVLRVMKGERLGGLRQFPVRDGDWIPGVPPRLFEVVLRFALPLRILPIRS